MRSRSGVSTVSPNAVAVTPISTIRPRSAAAGSGLGVTGSSSCQAGTWRAGTSAVKRSQNCPSGATGTIASPTRTASSPGPSGAARSVTVPAP